MAMKIAIRTVLKENHERLEWIVEYLQTVFGHSEAIAIDLLERFHQRFPAREFKELNPVVIERNNDVFNGFTDDIAYRIQFVEALGNPLDEEAFLNFYHEAYSVWEAKCDELDDRREAVNWRWVMRHYDMKQKTQYSLSLPLSVDLKDINRTRKTDPAIMLIIEQPEH